MVEIHVNALYRLPRGTRGYRRDEDGHLRAYEVVSQEEEPDENGTYKTLVRRVDEGSNLD